MGRLAELAIRLAGSPRTAPERRKSPTYSSLDDAVSGACSQPSERTSGVGGGSRTRLNNFADCYLTVWFHQHEGDSIIHLHAGHVNSARRAGEHMQMRVRGRRPALRVLSRSLVGPVDRHPSRSPHHCEAQEACPETSDGQSSYPMELGSSSSRHRRRYAASGRLPSNPRGIRTHTFSLKG